MLYFKKPDYKNHTYLAMPETAVLKDDSTLVDGQDPDVRRKSDDGLLKGHSNAGNRNPALLNQQHSEGHSPQLSRKQQQAESHPLTVGSTVAVAMGDRNVHGTIRWMGNIPNVPNVIAGVELVSVWVCVGVQVSVGVDVVLNFVEVRKYYTYIGTLYVCTSAPA